MAPLPPVHMPALLSWARFWQALALALGLFTLSQDIEYIYGLSTHYADAGDLGATLLPEATFAPGFSRLAGLAPQGALARAGVEAGDHVRFDRPLDYVRPLRAGESTGLVIDRKGKRHHVVATALPRVWAASDETWFPGRVLYGVMSLINALIGDVIIWRCGERTAPRLVGTALICFGQASSLPQLLESSPLVFMATLPVYVFTLLAIPVLLLAFAVHFYEDEVQPAPRWAHIGAYGYTALTTALGVAMFYCYLAIDRLPVVGDSFNLYTLSVFLGFGLTALGLVFGWLQARRVVQKRYAFMMMALLLIITSQVLTSIRVQLGHDIGLIDALDIAIYVTGIGGALLFTYAILRHHVLDLGFAVNRTLVYSILTTLLLVVFGVLEWASDHLLPTKTLETNALLDGGVALAIYLIFHRVRDVAEHAVERMFFYRWHLNEKALRKFVKQAGYITKARGLLHGFITELERFSDGAEIAIYQRDAEGNLKRVEGSHTVGPSHIDADNPIIVSLRAESEPMDISLDDHLPAALALPMAHRGELLGLALMGYKTSGDNYRPDEREVLGWAAHQIGLDLHALKVEDLEREAHDQQTRISLLDAQLQIALRGKDAPKPVSARPGQAPRRRARPEPAG